MMRQCMNAGASYGRMARHVFDAFPVVTGMVSELPPNLCFSMIFGGSSADREPYTALRPVRRPKCAQLTIFVSRIKISASKHYNDTTAGSL